MSFVEMTNEEWEAVYKQHDALIRKIGRAHV